MPALPQRLPQQLVRRITRHRLASFLSSTHSNNNKTMNIADVIQVSPAATGNDISHLLENENEYGIAKPMAMDAFRKEQYQFFKWQNA
mmetsp:Transcript_20860/g.39619  ORF Transcript_20860/g.39619 Transcript_20860/m.39619 type:complete len:88 (+) Transcript_20860:329-592(+)